MEILLITLSIFLTCQKIADSLSYINDYSIILYLAILSIIITSSILVFVITFIVYFPYLFSTILSCCTVKILHTYSKHRIIVISPLYEDTCIVCLESPNENPKHKWIKLCCKHKFHKHCWESWCERKHCCPICNKQIIVNNKSILESFF